MWQEVGILRTAASLESAQAILDALATEIEATGVPDPEPRYNLAFMDRLNLENLVTVSRAICASALARRNSCGAHFREDFSASPEPATARYTVGLIDGRDITVETEPVRFNRVRPGETLLADAAE